MKKKKMSFEEHLKAGRELYEFRFFLPNLSNKAVFHAIKSIDKLRSELEEEMFRNFPLKAANRIYYPGDKR